MISIKQPGTDELDIAVLRALNELPSDADYSYTFRPLDAPQGQYVTNSSIRKVLGTKSIETRVALKRLVATGFADVLEVGSIQYFSISEAGKRLLTSESEESVEDTYDSSAWTGIVTPPQVIQVLAILSEMEDACELIRDNESRAQIVGLIRALQIIVDLPNPPRRGVVELIRDPVFSNVVQVGTFLAALVAAIKG